MNHALANWKTLLLCCAASACVALGALWASRAVQAEADPPAKGKAAAAKAAESEKAKPAADAPAEKPAADSSDAPAAETPAEGEMTEEEMTEEEMTEEEEAKLLPTLEEMPIPTVEELFKQPVDWIIVRQLEEDRALAVKLVSPRPDTVAKMQAAIEESKKWPRPATEEERQKQREQRENLNWLSVFLPDAAEADNEYQLRLDFIQRIVYHEDLILKRAAIFMDEGKLRDAFELVYALERRYPKWPLLAESKNRLIFLESEAALQRNEPEAAFVYLEDLNSRNPKYPQLSARLGEVSDRLISEARKADDFRRARHFLRRLEKCDREHETARKWRDSLIAETRALMEKAQQLSTSGAYDQAAAAIDEAARIWPTAPGLAEAHRRFANRFQQLKVGVVRHAGEPTPYFLPTFDEERDDKLTKFRLFEVDTIDDSTHYRTPLFEQWTPIDLGRKVSFSLRPTRATWESKPIVTAGAIVSDISERIDPTSPRFDSRLGHFVQSLMIRSPFEFEVTFSRVPVRTEPLFRFPVESTRAAGKSEPGAQVLTRRFDRQTRDDGTVAYRRTLPQPDQLQDYCVAEIVERKYESHERALQALIRGDVSVLTSLRPWQLKEVKDDERFFVLPYAVPTTHVLQFNPRSKPAQVRELRSALAFGVDRVRLLKGIILRDPSANPDNYLSSAPYSRKNPAYSPVAPQRSSNLTLALALQLAAKKRLGGEIPTLKMVCVPDAVVDAVVPPMIAEWKRIGIKVEIITDPAKGSEADIIYRTVRMDEPMLQLWQFLALDQPPTMDAVAHLPDWLRGELIALENAGDWNTAIRTIHELHRDLNAEVEYIPLWELDDYMVVRKNIRNAPGAPLHPYQNIERWVVQSWFPTDTPEPSQQKTPGANPKTAARSSTPAESK